MLRLRALLVVLLTVFASSLARVTARAQAATPSPLGRCEARFFEPFARHTGATDEELTLALREEELPERVAHVHGWVKRRYGQPVAIEVVIASVPAPRDRTLRYAFDTTLRALSAGIEARAPGRTPVGHAGAFQRDHGFLPWDDPRDAPCSGEWPALVLFRSADPGEAKLLALLLVEESREAGVAPRALERAFTTSRALQKSWRSRSPLALIEPPVLPPVGVVAPIFASSAQPLRQAIDVLRRHGYREPIDIISGAADGLALAQTLRTPTFGSADPTRYATTSVPLEALRCAFLRHAAERGAPLAASEDGPAPVPGSLLVHARGDDTRTPHCALAFARELAYPAGLAGLSEERVARQSADLAESLVLDRALEQLTGRGIRWVAIDARDADDARAIARSVRARLPRAQLAFLHADALLFAADEPAALRGALLVSAYPFLGGRALVEDDPTGEPLHAFANAASQGVYNAARALRGVPLDELDEYVLPTRDPDAAEAPFTALAVWISALGRRGLSALSVSPALDCERARYGAEEPSATLCSASLGSARRSEAWAEYLADHGVSLDAFAHVTSRAWLRLLIGAFIALVAVQRLAAWRATRPRIDVRDVHQAALSLRAHLHVLGSGGALFAGALGLFSLHTRTGALDPLTRHDVGSSPELALLAAASVSWLWDVVLLARAVRSFVAASHLRVLRVLPRILGALGAGVLGSLVVVTSAGRAFDTSDAPSLFLARARALERGLSPVAPLSCALLAVVAWQLGRALRCAYVARDGVSAAQASRTRPLWWSLEALAFVAPFAARAWLATPLTLEAPPLDGLLVSALALIAAILVLELVSVAGSAEPRTAVLPALAGALVCGAAAHGALLGYPFTPHDQLLSLAHVIVAVVFVPLSWFAVVRRRSRS